MVGLVTLLRASLPEGARSDPASVNAMVSEAVTAPTVNIVASHNAFIMGDRSVARVGAVSGGVSPAEPKRRIGRWLKGILEAITTIGTAVSLLWGSSFNPM